MNDTFQMARQLYLIGELREEIWVQYMADELARNRTEKGINRIEYNKYTQ